MPKIIPEDSELPQTVSIQNVTLELWTIIITRTIVNHKWGGIIYSQHGGPQLSSWWFDKKSQMLRIQLKSFPN